MVRTNCMERCAGKAFSGCRVLVRKGILRCGDIFVICLHVFDLYVTLVWYHLQPLHFEDLFYIKHCVGCHKEHKYEEKKKRMDPLLPEMILK